MLADKKYRSILCLNGSLPSKDFFTGELPVIAADGAANKLAAMNVTPTLIIGDLDSVDPELLHEHEHLRDADQSTSDFQKCLTYMQAHHLLPSIIVGMNGGYLDHVLNNINIFLQTDSIFYAPPMLGITIKSGTSRSLSLPAGTKISLLGLPQATVTTRGLKWELDTHELSFPGTNSCFNRAHHGEVMITVESGNVLVLIYELTMNDAGWQPA